DRLQNVVQGAPANFRALIAKRSMLVLLVLKNVWIYGACADAVLVAHLGDFAQVCPCGEIPENVQRDAGAHAGEVMDLAGIGELLLEGRGGAVLQELPEACSCVGKSPGRYLDAE